MSEAKFKIGDRVRVADSDRSMHGKIGQVQRYETHMPSPYLVESECMGWGNWFTADELEPAPTVNKPKAPQPKFSVGDRVLIKSPASPMDGMACVVTATNAGMRSPYFVELKDLSRGSWFTADELEPAPTGNECLTVDNVNHPPHYNQGGIECIEAIKAALGDGFPDYLRGNVIKYLWRYKEKGGVEDLRKSAWYLDRLIKEMGNE